MDISGRYSIIKESVKRASTEAAIAFGEQSFPKYGNVFILGNYIAIRHRFIGTANKSIYYVVFCSVRYNKPIISVK